MISWQISDTEMNKRTKRTQRPCRVMEMGEIAYEGCTPGRRFSRIPKIIEYDVARHPWSQLMTVAMAPGWSDGATPRNPSIACSWFER